MKRNKMRPKLEDLSKAMLIYRCRILTHHSNMKSAELRHYKIRLKKMYNSIGYLLEHPYSRDTNMTTRKHKRDVSQKTKW